MLKRITREFGMLDVFKDFVIVVMNEGITVIPEYNKELVSIAEAHYPERLFGYITHRKNSYSVNPHIYFETSKISNLVGFAVVSENEKFLSTVEIEKKFLKQPFQTFKRLDEAKNWILQLIAENQNLSKQ